MMAHTGDVVKANVRTLLPLATMDIKVQGHMGTQDLILKREQ